jgi:hypothetical protein
VKRERVGSARRWLAAAAVVAACLLAAGRAGAVPAAELVARSRAAAARGDWNTSARALEELVAAGIDSSDVLYDLGTVYAHAGRYGEAIWRLEQVTRRSPFALDAQQNLRAARLALAHRDAARTGRAVVETALPFRTWLGELLPLDWAVALALACELGALGCFVLWRRRRAGEIARVGGAVGAVLLLTGALFAGAIVVARQATPAAAIVLRDGLQLLRAPTADAIAEAPVREGERVEVLGREGTFVRVRAPGGATGWLAIRDLGELE